MSIGRVPSAAGTLDSGWGLRFYAFMRTTVELPSDLLRRAKARAVARGESLKALLTRAVAAELGRSARGRTPRQRVSLPLFGNPDGPVVSVTSSDIARALAEDDAARVRAPRRRT
jgi:hypothetical protein